MPICYCAIQIIVVKVEILLLNLSINAARNDKCVNNITLL
jgi:hypothetical protein